MALTCISCKLLFSVPEVHHEHYKSDWHRYNLKRRIADLSPVTKDQFEARAAAFLAANQEKEKLSLKCATCNKKFSSENAKATHLKSKKHIEAAKKKPPEPIGDTLPLQLPGKFKDRDNDIDDDDSDSDSDWSDSDWESCDEEEEDRITVDTNDCLFCGHQSDAVETNLKHMTEAHSFFIPDIEFVADIDSLIGYLAGKIHVGHLCLWCHGKGKAFKSVKSVRQHMIDKGHCKMLHEGDLLLDYAEFYDYSSCDDDKEVFDEAVISNLLQDSEFELVLPSGATVGHRTLAMYYKQNLKPITPENERKIRKVLQYYKSVGYKGATGPAAAKTARDMNFVRRVKNRYDLKLGVRGNKLQSHFRPQVLF